MLRITVEEQENLTTLRLEGKLRGDWVPELERCWIHTRSPDPNRHLMIDMASVSFVDEYGKLLLRNLASQQVELLARGNPFMSALLSDISGRAAEQAAHERPRF